MNFKKGDLVIYMPVHANGIITHKDCEMGFVTSVVGDAAFCRFLRREESDGPFLDKESVIDALRTRANSEMVNRDCLIKMHGLISQYVINEVIEELYPENKD